MRIENDKVIGPRGDVLAEKVYGEWQTKDPTVLDFVASQDKPKKKSAKKKTDNSNTEVSETWVVKTAKKVLKK